MSSPMGSIGRYASHTNLAAFAIILVGLADAHRASALTASRGRLVLVLFSLPGLFVRPTTNRVSDNAAAIGEHVANGAAS